MPTAIYTEHVTDAMSWTGADFTSKEDFAFDLSSRNVAALESILAKTAKKDRDDITLDDAPSGSGRRSGSALPGPDVRQRVGVCARFPGRAAFNRRPGAHLLGVLLAPRLPGVEQLVRTSPGTGARGDPAQRCAARTRYQVPC